jgi:catechol 1,2-dioxygenase
MTVTKKHSAARTTISRRTFIQRNATILGGVMVAGPLLAADKACKLTQAEVVGPFYRFGAPFQAQLAGPDEPGQRLIIKGTVYGPDCSTPLPNTLLDIWQANAAGIYDTETPDNFTEEVEFKLRGMLYTDEEGRYEIETIMPGRYPIPPGLPGLEEYAGLTRPAHIHVKAMNSMHVPVTSQFYFAGDPYIAEDPWASKKPSLAIDLEDDGEVQRGTFDFVLGDGL